MGAAFGQRHVFEAAIGAGGGRVLGVSEGDGGGVGEGAARA